VTIGCVETTCDTAFDETNNSQKDLVDLDLVDDEEAPCDTLKRMAIGDVRPRDSNDQPQEQSPNDTTPPAQELDQDEHEEEDEHHDQVQEEIHDLGEMRMMGIIEKHHHIQECATIFKKITPLTIYLVISKSG
jgi:hypothetical protein